MQYRAACKRTAVAGYVESAVVTLLRCRAVFAVISQRLFRASQKDHSPRSTTLCSGSGKMGAQVNFFRRICFSENSSVILFQYFLLVSVHTYQVFIMTSFEFDLDQA